MTTRATTVVLALAIAASGAALGAVLLLSSSSKGGSATPPVSGSTVPPGPSVGSPPAGLLFDVTHYNGCTGNGVADCTVGIQAAIVAAQAKGSGSVWFPAGHYLVAGSGSADSLVVAAGAPVTLAGAGRDLSYIVERTKKRDLISIKANHTITQDLTFDTATNDGGHAWGSSADFTTLRRCRVVGGTNQYAARFTNSGAGATPEKPTYRIGNVVDDLILVDSAPGRDAGMDFDFQMNGSITNVHHTGSRLGLYADSHVTVTNYYFTPGSKSTQAQGFDITTPSDHITITNFVSSGDGGVVHVAPPGSARRNSFITICREEMTGGSRFRLLIGDVTNGLLCDSKLGTLLIAPNMQAQLTIQNTTYVAIQRKPAKSAQVDVSLR